MFRSLKLGRVYIRRPILGRGRREPEKGKILVTYNLSFRSPQSGRGFGENAFLTIRLITLRRPVASGQREHSRRRSLHSSGRGLQYQITALRPFENPTILDVVACRDLFVE